MPNSSFFKPHPSFQHLAFFPSQPSPFPFLARLPVAPEVSKAPKVLSSPSCSFPSFLGESSSVVLISKPFESLSQVLTALRPRCQLPADISVWMSPTSLAWNHSDSSFFPFSPPQIVLPAALVLWMTWLSSAYLHLKTEVCLEMLPLSSALVDKWLSLMDAHLLSFTLLFFPGLLSLSPVVQPYLGGLTRLLTILTGQKLLQNMSCGRKATLVMT